MPLTPPNLDDRRFEEILRDLQLRIPVYTREWTDFNDSDPGMTLVQLFAWLTETTLFRLNKVPERSYIKFLQLLGAELTPAAPASAFVSFTTAPGTPAPTVPKRAQIAAQPPEGGDPIVFETEEPLDLIQAELTDVWVSEGSGVQSVGTQNKTAGVSFRPLGFVPLAGNALYLGFKPPPQPLRQRVFPSSMTFRAFLPEAALAGKPQLCTGGELNLTPPVDLEWEFRPSGKSNAWQRLNVFADESVAFTREGFIRVEGPPSSIEATIEQRLNAEKRFWIRVRMVRGAYDAGAAPQLDLLIPNTVEVRNLTTLRSEPVGRSEGVPDQVFRVRRPPVFVDATNRQDPLMLRTTVGDKTIKWERRDDFLGSGPADRHYTLNANSGEIRFGDGRRGQIPEPTSEIVAEEYRYGGGSAGNKAKAGLIQTPRTSLPGVKEVKNWREAAGGGDEQSVADLAAQAPTLLRRRDRAVTPEDFVSLARDVGVKKAVALSQRHPDHPGVAVPGAITVVIVGDSREKKPLPSGDLIRAVCRKLDQHRLITTEVYVKGPEYQGVRVEAKVEAEAHASFDTVTRDVIEALDNFLSPLNKERRFGRDLIPTELYNVIRGVAQVVSVQRLNVYVDGRPVPETERIRVPEDGLLYAEDHLIVVVPEQNL